MRLLKTSVHYHNGCVIQQPLSGNVYFPWSSRLHQHLAGGGGGGNMMAGRLVLVIECIIKVKVCHCKCVREREGGDGEKERVREEGGGWREMERERLWLSLCEHLYPERSEVVHHIIAVAYTNIFRQGWPHYCSRMLGHGISYRDVYKYWVHELFNAMIRTHDWFPVPPVYYVVWQLLWISSPGGFFVCLLIEARVWLPGSDWGDDMFASLEFQIPFGLVNHTLCKFFSLPSLFLPPSLPHPLSNEAQSHC